MAGPRARGSGAAVSAQRTVVQPWVRSAAFDGLWILAPAWVVGCALLSFPGMRAAGSVVSPLTWLLLVVGIDVAHVYATLFRTYLDRDEMRARSSLYCAVPLVAYVLCVLLYVAGERVFWSVLAYVAVFHFVRQQYGLMMLYRRSDRDLPQWMLRMDQAFAYAVTLYPLLWWHANLPREYVWFVPGDFLPVSRALLPAASAIYVVLLLLWCGQHAVRMMRGRANLPLMLLLAGTALSWYCGIVLTDGDLGFTFANVLAHGIPYIALTWLYRDNSTRRRPAVVRRSWLKGWLVYLTCLVALAWIEEGIWDGMIWREHGELFGWSTWLPWIKAEDGLALLVPLLALPQVTHYILDGFIWRLRSHPEWRDVLLYRQRSREAQG